MNLFQNYRQQVKEGIGLALQVRVSLRALAESGLRYPPGVLEQPPLFFLFFHGSIEAKR
jgi:hypothetical protein